MRDFIKTNKQTLLILEDNIIFKEFNQYLNRTNHDWDIIFISDGYNFHPPHISKDIASYKMPVPNTKCVDTVIYNKNSTIKILEKFKKFSLPVDWEFAYIFDICNLNVY